jgi:hypothetical protein
MRVIENGIMKMLFRYLLLLVTIFFSAIEAFMLSEPHDLAQIKLYKQNINVSIVLIKAKCLHFSNSIMNASVYWSNS